MRTTISIVILAALVSVCSLTCIIALYTAGALAAAQAVRSVPFVGPIASARIEAWVMGATEPHTIDDVHLLGTDTPMQDARTFTGTVPDGGWGPEDCKIPRGLPVAGHFTSGFRPPNRPDHTGVDIGVVDGTPVQATQCGIVTFAGWSDIGYGYLVVVQHDTYSTYYAHNEKLYVEAGAQVGLGQVIAASGSTGNSTGPHVHYETRVDGVPEDPLTSFP